MALNIRSAGFRPAVCEAAQMITAEALEGQSAEKVPPAPPWHKTLVAFAGPFMNVVLRSSSPRWIYFVGLPIPVNPAIIGYVEPGSAEAKLRPSGRRSHRVGEWRGGEILAGRGAEHGGGAYELAAGRH